MKVLLIGAAAALAFGGAALAQDGRRGPMAADTDGDGRLSQAEFVASALARFDGNDANRDGVITTDEVQAAMQARRGEMRERIFAALDADSDGMISRAEFEASGDRRAERGAGAGRRGGRGFGRIEADGVTRAEAETRAAAMFARMDADDDGFLTAEDRQGRRWGRRGQSAE